MVDTTRAVQNTYAINVNGGTRNPTDVMTDITAFMDAVEDESTAFLDSLGSKGAPVNQHRHEWGQKGVNARGSVSAGAIAAADTAINLPTGHGARFQQGHVLLFTRLSDNATELIHVLDDPAVSSLPLVRRAQGGTTALDFVANDKIAIVGVALPQGVDFPLSPVSRGKRYFNFEQKFGYSYEWTDEHENTPDYFNPTGDYADDDWLQIAKASKRDLNEALVFGMRQDGSPDPTAPIPSMLGGARFWLMNSGNVYNVGGSSVMLTIEAFEEVVIRMDDAVGSNAGTKLLMSLRTHQIWDRLLHPFKYTSGVPANQNGTVDLRWKSVTTEVGTYEFTHMKGIPDGEIWIYNPKYMKYMAYKGMDWREKEVPTQGDYSWRGMSGTFTFEAKALPTMAILRSFDTNLTHYPKWGQPALV